EDTARRFWVDALGMVEVQKPADLAGRGGAWFRAYEADGTVGAEIHVGVEDSFTPAAKAHPALVVDDLDAVRARLREQGYEVDDSQRHTFPPHLRCHTRDGHGNRVELLQQPGDD
ncbi:MAG: VOC family protein, partial [Nocardioides sp.]|uniref:VOC family protein n=1 Tax=Nocardioides sp. TaxID=35761 RepID=UPI003F0906F1